MTYSLHPEATKELEEALSFYREQGGVGLARAFLAEFERVAIGFSAAAALAVPAKSEVQPGNPQQRLFDRDLTGKINSMKRLPPNMQLGPARINTY